MVKVKTFTTPLKVYHVHEELNSLDEQVNEFLSENKIKKVVSVNDSSITDETGAAIGIVRVVTYETP